MRDISGGAKDRFEELIVLAYTWELLTGQQVTYILDYKKTTCPFNILPLLLFFPPILFLGPRRRHERFPNSWSCSCCYCCSRPMWLY